MENSLPPAQTFRVTQTEQLTIHTLMSPAPFFANATHIIELPTQLILVDGHYFAPYAHQFRALADSLNKPITRFYVSHDHPDHYLGMGDAFADVTVYALPAIRDSIHQHGADELAAKQAQFGPLMASRLQLPTQVVTPGREVIDGVEFRFEEIRGAESSVALAIHLPQAGVYVAQDLVYNHTHLFISGPTAGWRNELDKLNRKENVDIILAGHGEPTDKTVIARMQTYLDRVDALLAQGVSPESYKATLLAEFPDYAADRFIDIYSPMLFSGVPA